MCKCVTFAFLVAHVAVILFITALASTYWSRTTDINHTYHKGLWKLCINNDCKYGAEYVLNTTEVQTFYKATQIIYSIAGGSCAFGTFLLYFAMLSETLTLSKCFNGFTRMVLGLSALEGVTAVILFRIYLDQDRSYPEGYRIELYWSFNVAIASIVAVFVAMLTNFRYHCTLRPDTRKDFYHRF